MTASVRWSSTLESCAVEPFESFLRVSFFQGSCDHGVGRVSWPSYTYFYSYFSILVFFSFSHLYSYGLCIYVRERSFFLLRPVGDGKYSWRKLSGSRLLDSKHAIRLACYTYKRPWMAGRAAVLYGAPYTPYTLVLTASFLV